MPDYVANWIYIGNHDDVDNVEGATNLVNENTDIMLQTFTANNSSMQIVETTAHDVLTGNTAEDGFLREDDRGADAEAVSYDLGTGTVSSDLDSITYYNSTIQYEDGTSVDTDLYVMQLQNGDSFIVSGKTHFDNQNVESVTFNGVTNDLYAKFTLPTQSFENVEFVVCFVAGTTILTENGEIPVEELKIGDRVQTYDHGLKPVQFIYASHLKTNPENYPVHFEKGSIGNFRALRVSPHHRMFTSTLPRHIRHRLKLPPDSIIWAKELCDGVQIWEDYLCREVTYYHIMLDRHELVYTHGAVSESWQPTRKNLKRNPELKRALLKAFPEIKHLNGLNQGRLVRPEITTDPNRTGTPKTDQKAKAKTTA